MRWQGLSQLISDDSLAPYYIRHRLMSIFGRLAALENVRRRTLDSMTNG
jgi:hypothetical protein